MNLSPEWVELLNAEGFDVVHWSSIGKPNAPDEEIFAHARAGGWAILTQDLDFPQLLFRTRDNGPSTVLLRLGDELNAKNRLRVASIIRRCEADIETGALLVIDENKARLRLLPVRKG